MSQWGVIEDGELSEQFAEALAKLNAEPLE